MAVLENAYELIRNGRLDDAQALLDAHRDEFASNADYWWLVAHATTDPEAGRAALGRVLLLDKEYPGARALDEEVRSAEQMAEPRAERRPRRLPAYALAALLVLAVLLTAFLVLNANQADDQIAAAATATATEPAGLQLGAQASPTATLGVAATEAVPPDVTETEPEQATRPEQAATATPEPTATLEQAATATPEPTATVAPEQTPVGQAAEPIPVTYSFMQGQLTPENGVLLIGNRLSISLCAVPGIGAGNAIRDLLMTVSIGTAELDASTETIEIGIVDCEAGNTEQRVVAVPRQRIEAYSRGEITLQQLQQSIVPVR